MVCDLKYACDQTCAGMEMKNNAFCLELQFFLWRDAISIATSDAQLIDESTGYLWTVCQKRADCEKYKC